MSYPVLYSLRHCPYAMRARIAIYLSGQSVILRDIVLTDKPAAMLIASPKGTVPVLVLAQAPLLPTSEPKTIVIEESLQIMLWALNNSDPNNLLYRHNPEKLNDMLALIAIYDDEFKQCLNRYKCSKRYHGEHLDAHRQACEVYIRSLEQRLCQHDFLMGEKESLADIAILPFIRQFARVERQWYLASPYPKLRTWLNRYLQSKVFSKVMTKYPLWREEQAIVLFP